MSSLCETEYQVFSFFDHKILKCPLVDSPYTLSLCRSELEIPVAVPRFVLIIEKFLSSCIPGNWLEVTQHLDTV